jgi:hypothetical protein
MTRVGCLAATLSGVVAASMAAAACGDSPASPPPGDSGAPRCFFGCEAGPPPAPRDGGSDSPPPGSDGSSATDAPSLHDDAGKPLGAQCKPGAAWKNDSPVPSIAAKGFDRFGSISDDELTVAWAANDGTVWVADRTSTTVDFAKPAQIDTSKHMAATGERPALGPAGLSLVIVSADGASLYAFGRSSQGATWAPTSQSELASINGMVQGNMGQFSEPVLGADGVSLFFMFSVASAPPLLVESRYDGTAGAWLPANGFSNPELQTTNPGQPRRPTGLSADGRTLFFYDATTATERAAWRDSLSSPFTYFDTLAAPTEASPNRFCTTLYFQGEGNVANGLYEAL